MHTWADRATASECDVTVSPDGSVEAKLGSQDLGTAHGPASALSLPKRSIAAQKRQGRDSAGRIPEVRSFGGSTTIGGSSFLRPAANAG